MLPRMKSKHWCLTINNPTREDRDLIQTHQNLFAYYVFGNEVGEDGTPHMQGYAVFVNRVYLTGAKKVFPRAHLEIKAKKSTFVEAITYCKKEGDFMEYGIAPLDTSIRTKRRWDDAFEAATNGRYEDIPKDMLVRYYHAFRRIHQDNPEKPVDLDDHSNYWIVGETGVGKSYYARKRFPNFFDKAPNKWFIGYKGEPTLLIDDLEPGTTKFLSWYLKRWADLYSFPMETKGGGHQIRPKHVVVTSQYRIDEMHLDDKQIDAIQRRFTVIELTHWKTRINFKI